MESPRLPPLVFKLNSHKPERICHGIDVVRCRKNALAPARFPAPIFCPKDNMEQARENHLADLTYVKLPEDGRWAAFKQLPYVGQGWYAKPAVAYMLEKGLATWRDFVYSLDATAHVDQESVTLAADGGLARGRGALREAVGERPHRALGAQHGPHLHHAHQQPPVRRLRLPAPRAVPGRRGRDALGPHLRDPTGAVGPRTTS